MIAPLSHENVAILMQEGGEGEGVILLKLSISCKEWDQQSFNFCLKSTGQIKVT